MDLFKKNYLKEWVFEDNFHTACNGRILLAWNPSRLVVNVSHVEPQVIQATVECLSMGNKFQLALCYGRNQLQDRRQLWDSLINSFDLELPLLVCGDMNNVMDFDELVGGRPPIEREIRELADTAAYLNLQDAPSTGCFFTWTNDTMFSRIDRIMFNNTWLDKGWAIKSHFHTRGERFDHSPCTAELFNPD